MADVTYDPKKATAALKGFREAAAGIQNFLAWVKDLPVMVEGVEQAEVSLRNQAQRAADLDAEIARLAPEAERLRAEVAGFRRQRDAQAQELKAQAAPLRETLADLERQVAAKREELERVKATLRDLGARVVGAA